MSPLPWRALALVLVLSFGPAKAETLLFLDDFSGGSGVGLNGLSPDVTTGGASWVSSSIVSANGGIASTNPGSATLAFTPKINRVYTLDASFRNMAAGSGAATPNEDDWFAVGFASGQSTGSTTNDRFLSGNVIGRAWSMVRGSTTTSGNNNAFLGSSTVGNADGAPWAGLATAHAGDMDMRVVLDTSISNGGGWTASWYDKRPTDSDYTLVRDTAPLLSTAINSVGIAKSNTGVTGTISSFSLSEAPGVVSGPPVEPFIQKIPIGQGYGLNTINGTSFSRNNLATVGDQQFAAFYEPDTAADDGYDGNVVIARRTIGSDTWQLSETNFLSNNITDTHDVIAIAVDGDGIMHMSWGMHANQGGGTNYARSTTSVLAADSPIVFTANLAQGGFTGNETNVTYPEFVRLSDGDLLFFYRQGSSGDGDLRLNRYDTATDSWSVVRQPLIDGFVAGDAASANAYWNTPTIDSAGDLHLTWSFRRLASSFQTNHDLSYAVSSDNGATWRMTDGTPYPAPITQSNSDLVVSIPEGYSYINQTSMTVDMNNRPVVASRWAPEAGSGNDQAQQMIEWFDGTDWQVSQITDFAPGASAGRRPAVLVDQDDRVLVLISGSSLGNLVLAHSLDRENWDFLALDGGPNALEPTYDLVRWQRDGIISMLYQPTGTEATTLSLFEFDARTYFTPVPEPATLALLACGGAIALALRRRQRRATCA